jgi:hypothetical protein
MSRTGSSGRSLPTNPSGSAEGGAGAPRLQHGFNREARALSMSLSPERICLTKQSFCPPRPSDRFPIFADRVLLARAFTRVLAALLIAGVTVVLLLLALSFV